MTDKWFAQLKENLRHHYRMILSMQEKYRSETGHEFCPAGIGKIETPVHRRGCETYTPDDAPEIEVYYSTDPDTGVDIHDILVNGQEVSEPVYDLLAERDWETEIDAFLTERAESARQDALIEAWEIRQLERRSA